MSVGLRVLRGPDWSSDDRDGGEGHLGTVVSVGGEGTCSVLWDNGGSTLTRIGKSGKHDLRIFDSATVGVRHSQITCDGCESNGIAGMRWKCAQCKKCDLCALCYVMDKHDLTHEFIRFDSQDSTGVKVKKRSASLKIRAMGLFPGAKVERGSDWDSGNVDGGSGQVGEVISVTNNVNAQSTRNKVKVRWPSGQVSDHRVGYQGKMDVKYTEESQGTYYYKDHLPFLDESSGAQAATSRQPDVIQEGDKVCIHVTAASLKAMQSQRSGWTSGMNNCIGKIGVVKAFTPSGDATVEFGGFRFRFFPGALKKVPTVSAGVTVKIDSDEESVKSLQHNHGGWKSNMKQVLGKCGKVEKVDDDGDLLVAFGKRTYLLHPACCSPAPGSRISELEDATESTSTSGSDVHGDILRMMARLMKDTPGVSTGDPDVLYHAVGQGDASLVRTIVTKSPEVMNVKHKGVTALILAAHEGKMDIVKVLLEKGADTELTDNKGHTPLHAALIGKHQQIAQLLLDKGANAQVCNCQKRTPLHFAAYSNNADVMPDIIRRGCNVNAKDEDGDTALHDAIAKGYQAAVAVLMRAAKIDLTVTNAKGFNALQFACFTGNASATEAILKRDISIVNVQKQGVDMYAALHIAAVNNHVECAKLLLEVGKAKVNIQNKSGLTALHLACHEAYYQCTELLLENGADPNIKDEDGDTALHITLGRTGGTEEQQMLASLLGVRSGNDDETRVKIACLLLQKNALLDVRNNSGATPLAVTKSQSVRQAVNLFVRQNESGTRRVSSASGGDGDGTRINLGGLGGLLSMPLPCSKCHSKISDITLKPCGHRILCRKCCLTTQNCPLCEAPIERRLAKKNETVSEECKVQ